MLTTYAARFATVSPIAFCSFVFRVVSFIIDDFFKKIIYSKDKHFIYKTLAVTT